MISRVNISITVYQAGISTSIMFHKVDLRRTENVLTLFLCSRRNTVALHFLWIYLNILTGTENVSLWTLGVSVSKAESFCFTNNYYKTNFSRSWNPPSLSHQSRSAAEESPYRHGDGRPALSDGPHTAETNRKSLFLKQTECVVQIYWSWSSFDSEVTQPEQVNWNTAVCWGQPGVSPYCLLGPLEIRRLSSFCVWQLMQLQHSGEIISN